MSATSSSCWCRYKLVIIINARRDPRRRHHPRVEHLVVHRLRHTHVVSCRVGRSPTRVRVGSARGLRRGVVSRAVWLSFPRAHRVVWIAPVARWSCRTLARARDDDRSLARSLALALARSLSRSLCRRRGHRRRWRRRRHGSGGRHGRRGGDDRRAWRGDARRWVSARDGYASCSLCATLVVRLRATVL